MGIASQFAVVVHFVGVFVSAEMLGQKPTGPLSIPEVLGHFEDEDVFGGAVGMVLFAEIGVHFDFAVLGPSKADWQSKL